MNNSNIFVVTLRDEASTSKKYGLLVGDKFQGQLFLADGEKVKIGRKEDLASLVPDNWSDWVLNSKLYKKLGDIPESVRKAFSDDILVRVLKAAWDKELIKCSECGDYIVNVSVQVGLALWTLIIICNTTNDPSLGIEQFVELFDDIKEGATFATSVELMDLLSHVESTEQGLVCENTGNVIIKNGTILSYIM